jgi:very-short-patch-repair endonuclease
VTNLTRNKTDLADTLLLHIRAQRLPPPIRDYQALLPRKFKCDLAWPERKLCIEVDGGELMRGRHNRAAGMASDCVKQNLLVLAGWKTLRFTGQQVKDGSALAVVREALARFRA